MLTVAIPKRNKLQNIIVLTPKDGTAGWAAAARLSQNLQFLLCRFWRRIDRRRKFLSFGVELKK